MLQRRLRFRSMWSTSSYFAATAFGLMTFAAGPALAGSPIGEWLVADKTARVAVRSCGANICGKISWTDDGQDLGKAILIDMKPDGGRWTGTVVDVRDNTKYLARLALESDQTIKLDGCVLGGAICSGEVWTRFK